MIRAKEGPKIGVCRATLPARVCQGHSDPSVPVPDVPQLWHHQPPMLQSTESPWNLKAFNIMLYPSRFGMVHDLLPKDHISRLNRAVALSPSPPPPFLLGPREPTGTPLPSQKLRAHITAHCLPDPAKQTTEPKPVPGRDEVPRSTPGGKGPLIPVPCCLHRKVPTLH